WKPRQTVYAQSPPQDDALHKEDADALAIRDGVSPRRKTDKVAAPVTYCNGSKPRASSHTFVGERHPTNHSGGGSVLKPTGSPQPPTAAQTPAEGAMHQQSPRRPPHVSSGPCLFTGTAGNGTVLREVQYGREDPSLLSFAEKTHMFNARSQSQGDPGSRRPSRPVPQPSQAPAAVAQGAVPRPSPSVSSGLNGYDPSRGFAFAPNSRNTIPMTMKPCVQPPAPANIARSAATTPQQLTPPGPNQAQIYGGVHARGRSTSPAYNAGPPGFVQAAMRHPQPVIYRR
ncbi:gly-4, partial [Symbiodinium natans]